MRRAGFLLAATLVAFTASMAFYLLKPALALRMRAEMGASAVEVAALTAGFMLSRALSATLAGVAADRRQGFTGDVVRFGLVPVAAVAAGYAFASVPVQALVLSGVHGFLSGMLWLCMQVNVACAAGRGRRNTWLGVYFTAGTLGSAAGYAAYAALPLANREVLMLAAGMYGVSAAVALLMLGDSLAMQRDVRREGEGFTALTFWVLGVAFLAGGAAGLMNEYLYVFLTEVRGLSRVELGYMLAVATLAGAAGGVGAGYLADRWSMRGVVRVLLLAAGAGLLGVAFLDSGMAVMLGVAGVVMASRALMPMLRNVDIAGSGAAGTAVGLSNTLSNAGSALLPVAAGWVYEASASAWAGGAVFAACGVMMLGFAVLCPAGRRGLHTTAQAV